MFEGIASTIISRVLGTYIEDLDSQNLSFNILSGDALLQDLRLKTDALAVFQLPILIKQGYIGSIHINAPWTSLNSAPIVVTISDIFIVAGPRKGKSVGEHDVKKALILSRLQALQSWEDIRFPKPEADAEPGYIEKTIENALDNARIVIKRIHIRSVPTSVALLRLRRLSPMRLRPSFFQS